MPMDDREKKELVKKIMEQRKALWKGEDKTNRKSESFSQFHQENMEKANTEVDPTDKIPMRDIPIEITQVDDSDADDKEPSGKKEKLSLMAELKKAEELGLKVIFAVVGILISALLLGVLIGYGITALNF